MSEETWAGGQYNSVLVIRFIGSPSLASSVRYARARGDDTPCEFTRRAPGGIKTSYTSLAAVRGTPTRGSIQDLPARGSTARSSSINPRILVLSRRIKRLCELYVWT